VIARALLWATLLVAGCRDDRPAVLNTIFTCDPESGTADYDCGDGQVCYPAASAIGHAICVPSCDPANPDTCPGGACTSAGECLTRCSVEQSNPCPGGGKLSCVRITYSPLEIANGLDGMCLPVGATCATTNDCRSGVYDFCSSATNGSQIDSSFATSGAFCAQSGCSTSGVACEPGSSCLPLVLPLNVGHVDDICTPNCIRRSRPGDMGMVEECIPGYTCVNTSFPQTDIRVCTPGMPGFLCDDSLGCTTGACQPWTDVGGDYAQVRTCSPTCQTDDDCLAYDNTDNSIALDKFTCHNGYCRQFTSITSTELCLHAGSECLLDPQASCESIASLIGNPDLAAPDPCNGGALLAFIDITACIRSCTTDDDCQTLTTNTHALHTCVVGFCFPSLPATTPCTSDAVCAPGLHCLKPANAKPVYPNCTISCSTHADCVNHPALGSSFACTNGQCVGKTQAGCQPLVPSSDYCLGGKLVGGVCLSPSGWTCNKDSLCESGVCDRTTGTRGHCR
jgi:hypothetical protein